MAGLLHTLKAPLISIYELTKHQLVGHEDTIATLTVLWGRLRHTLGGVNYRAQKEEGRPA